jgi:hypothetical protein
MSTGGDVGSAQALSHELQDSGDLFARHVELLDDFVDAEILEVLDDRGHGYAAAGCRDMAPRTLRRSAVIVGPSCPRTPRTGGEDESADAKQQHVPREIQSIDSDGGRCIVLTGSGRKPVPGPV